MHRSWPCYAITADPVLLYGPGIVVRDRDIWSAERTGGCPKRGIARSSISFLVMTDQFVTLSEGDAKDIASMTGEEYRIWMHVSKEMM